MRNQYKEFQNSSMHVSKVMLCIKKRDEQTDERPRSNMPRQLLRIWGHNNILLLSAELAVKMVQVK